MRKFSTLLEGKELRNKVTFVRFGGLSSVPQKKERVNTDPFHYPPANRGIYAFPLQYIEPFLLGGLFDSRRHIMVLDKNSTLIKKNKKPKKFQYSGNIWSHLEFPNNEVLQRSGSWVLTDMYSYLKAYKKERGRLDYQKRLPTGFYGDIDHMEVL